MENLNIALIGCGMIGREHIERIQNRIRNAKVVAVCDVFEEGAKKGAEIAGAGTKVYTDFNEAINDPDVNAVVVTTPGQFHKGPVLAAIKAGKPVFSEKPLANTAADGKEIVEAEMASGKQLVQVGFMRRYDPGYGQLKKAIDSGKYGQPLMLHCVHRNYDAPGFTTSMPVENSMIHEIDVLRWLLGENYKTAEVVFPKTTRNAEGELRDPQIMYLTTESGVRIDVESFVNCRYGYDVRCEVVCEEGCINLPEPANAMIRTNDSRVTPICHDWSERFPEAYNIEFQSWINACKEGRVDGPSAWDGYVGQVTAKAASKARDTQTVVEIHYDEMPDFYKK